MSEDRTTGRAPLTVEYTLNIDRKDIIPAFLFWKIIIRSTPSNSRVVNQNMQFRFAFFEFGDESVAAGFGAYVCYDVLHGNLRGSVES